MAAELDIQQLRFFAAVAEAGSVNRAAHQLNIAQSALSRRIKLLEHGLGVELLHRGPDGVRLTDAGQRILRQALPLLRAYEKFCAAVDYRDQTAPTRIKLGMTASVAAFLLSGLASRVRRQLPDVEFQVIEGATHHLHDWVVSGEVDFALLTSPEPDRRLETQRIWREAIFLVGPPGHGQRGMDFAHLTKLPFVLTTRSSSVRRVFDEQFRRAGHRLKIGMQMEAVAPAKRLVEGGNAFTILPFPAVAREVSEGRLRARRLDNAFLDRVLAWRVGMPMSRDMKRLVTVLKTETERTMGGADWAELMHRRKTLTARH